MGELKSTAWRRRRILGLALPIIGGMVSQNLLNVVDTAMVGRLGDDALAAVGLGSFANFMAMAFVMGMGAGVQAAAARRLGEGRRDRSAVPLNGGLLLAAAVAVPWSLALVWAAPKLFSYLVSDPAVVGLGVPYLRVRLLAVLGVGMNFAYRGYWNAVDMSRVYMGTLVLMHATNIFLNWVLIFGHLGAPALGVTGAGIASAVSVYVGSLRYTQLAVRLARPAGFLTALPTRGTLTDMVRVSVPAGTQQFLFAAGMTMLFWIVGQVGTPELAAAHVLITMMLLTILPAIGFGLTAATLVGQALGSGDVVEAKRWGWQVGAVAAVAVSLIAVPQILVPKILLSIFITDPSTLALASIPLQIAGAAVIVDALGLVLLNAHLGAGDSRRVMIYSAGLQWGVFLPSAYLLGPVLGYGLLAIWAANAAFRILSAGVFSWSWESGRWATARV